MKASKKKTPKIYQTHSYFLLAISNEDLIPWRLHLTKSGQPVDIKNDQKQDYI